MLCYIGTWLVLAAYVSSACTWQLVKIAEEIVSSRQQGVLLLSK